MELIRPLEPLTKHSSHFSYLPVDAAFEDDYSREEKKYHAEQKFSSENELHTQI